MEVCGGGILGMWGEEQPLKRTAADANGGRGPPYH